MKLANMPALGAGARKSLRVRVPPPALFWALTGAKADVLLLVLRVKRDGPHKMEAPWPPDTSRHRQAKKSSPQKMWTSLNAEPRRPANAPRAPDSRRPGASRNPRAITQESQRCKT